ncbi:nudix hydrolase [Escherichia phage EcS1]|uniref:NTP pyrophosphohydrolases n=1 Tax=Escherichia phage EcS1 TaxID=2083276 RepID=A0A2Z5ZCH9_9CAUD|nr:nudix hydrolase [Escherichia phage EcS1]BBC78187.1 NTP pyrophosphohydrolases [Escherichia phage EcS1]
MTKVKELSAGILFFTKEHHLFMGRVTGSGLAGKGHRWDIPKGHVEEGETVLQAAVRECTEETSFEKYNPGALVDLGRHDYAPNKDIHLFVYPFAVEVEDFKGCVCTAQHTGEDGVSFPELDAFAFIQPRMWNYVMGPSLYNVMQKLYGKEIHEANWK